MLLPNSLLARLGTSAMFANLAALATLANVANVANAQNADLSIGTPICLTGYIMDTFCIQRGRLLDPSGTTTLLHAERHTYHCLFDVDVCIDSGFVLLGDKEMNENNPQRHPYPRNEAQDSGDSVGNDGTNDLYNLYCLGFRLDMQEQNKLLSAGRALGQSGSYPACDTCENTSANAPIDGYRATIRGVISDLGDGSNSVDGIPVVSELEVLGADVGCEDWGTDSYGNGGGPTIPPMCRAGAGELEMTMEPTGSPTYSPTQDVGNAVNDGNEGNAANMDNADSSSVDCTEVMCTRALSEEYTLRYQINVPDGSSASDCSSVECTMTMELTLDGEAWVGIGFSTDGNMVGSEAVIGIPGDNGHAPKKFSLEGFSPDAVVEMPSDQQTLTDASIEYNSGGNGGNGQTIMRFTKIMNEPNEIPIVVGGSTTNTPNTPNTFLWAHGDSTNFIYHGGSNRAAFELVLPGVPSAEDLDGGDELAIGDEVCIVGYIMDNFCINRGNLLDPSGTTTLLYPDVHTFHCLFDVDSCVNSGFMVLGDADINENNPQAHPFPENLDQDSADAIDGDLFNLHCLGFRLDDTDAVTAAGRALGSSGSCTTCTNGDAGAPASGYRATIKGKISELGDGSNTPSGAPLLTDLQVLEEGVGCDGAMTVPPLCRAGGGEVLVDCTQEMCTHELSADYYLQWKVNVPEGSVADDCSADVECTVDMEVTYFDGEAWLGFGFSENGMMLGSEAVIGIPGADGHEPMKFDLNGFSADTIVEMPSDQQTLSDVSVEAADGQTVMKFTKLMNEPNSDELVIVPGINTFIWAHGSSTTFGYHSRRGNFEVDILEAPRVEMPSAAPATPATPPAPPAAPTPATAPGAATDCTQEFCENVLTDTLLQRYMINVPEDTDADVCAGCTMSVELIYDGESWLGFGFTTNGQMTGSEAVIGILGDGAPLKYIMNSRDQAGIVRMPDSQQTLTGESIEFTNGQTILKFTKIMDEPGEITITTADNQFLWAHGQSATFGYHLGDKAAFSLNLSSGTSEAVQVPNKSAWLAHGIMGFLAWGAFVPFAVQSSLLRSLLPAGPLWFNLHRAFNTTAYALFIALFAVAVAYVGKEGGTHFFDKHHKMGLAMFIMAFVQILGGVLRPHTPAAGESKTPVRSGWEVGHRVMGVALLGCGFWQIYEGIELFGVKYSVDPSKVLIAYWVWIGVMVALMLLGGFLKMRGGSNDAGGAVVEADEAVAVDQNATAGV